MTKMLELPARLEEAGVNVRTLDGWENAHEGGTYLYREPNGEPAGHMHHHTATTEYTPNRDKANGYAGLSHGGSARLAQENYGGGVPVYTIANAYPAPISSGTGDRNVLDKVRAGIEVTGRPGPDTYDWYGNTHYWNTEYILDGTGSPVDPAVWAMMLTVSQVQNQLMGWTPFMHIGHGHHTGRKIDLWNGLYADYDETIIQLREQMGESVFTHFYVGDNRPEYESISWLLYMMKGGVVDPNGNSSQITAALPWKTDPRQVQAEDFAYIGELTNMTEFTLDKLIDSGLYRFGKEVASLEERAYRQDA